MSTGQPESVHAVGVKLPTPQPHASVFVFIACPDEILTSFAKQVNELGASGRVESIAVAVYPSPEYFQAFLEENRKDVCCVTIDLREPNLAKELIGIAARSVPDAVVLATGDSQGDEALPAVRAGAKEILAPPFDMRAAIRATSTPKTPGKGKIACFLPSQGGSGASTVAIHFAASIAAELETPATEGPKTSSVLLLDLDFHSDSAAFWLNKRPAYTLLDALEGAAPSSTYWRKITTAWNGVDLLAPPPPDSYISEEKLAALPKALAAASATYPWVIVDLPPALFASSRRLLPQTDLVFLVCTPEARSLYLARRRLTELKALGVPQDGLRITLNRAGAKRSIEAATAEMSIGTQLSVLIDNDYLEISSAYSDRRLASPKSAPGRQFAAMARVALGMQDHMPEKASGWRRLVGLG